MLEEFGRSLSKVNAIKHTCGSETHAAQAVRPGRLKSSVFSADVDSEEPLDIFKKAAALVDGGEF